jgi:hypothetical protein
VIKLGTKGKKYARHNIGRRNVSVVPRNSAKGEPAKKPLVTDDALLSGILA